MANLGAFVTFFALSFAAACSDASPPGPEARGSTTAAAHTIDRAHYCEQACERAATCSLESAEKIARGTPKEAAILQRWRDDRNARAACVDECAGAPSTDSAADAHALAAADRCLGQTTCETFARCLSEIE